MIWHNVTWHDIIAYDLTWRNMRRHGVFTLSITLLLMLQFFLPLPLSLYFSLPCLLYYWMSSCWYFHSCLSIISSVLFYCLSLTLVFFSISLSILLFSFLPSPFFNHSSLSRSVIWGETSSPLFIYEVIHFYTHLFIYLQIFDGIGVDLRFHFLMSYLILFFLFFHLCCYLVINQWILIRAHLSLLLLTLFFASIFAINYWVNWHTCGWIGKRKRKKKKK